MGKRKPSLSCPPPADAMRCSSGMDSLTKEMSSHSVETKAPKPILSFMDMKDNSLNIHSTHPSHTSHNHSLSHSIFLKRSRHCFGHQYSRRNSINHSKGTPLHDEKLFLKSSQCYSDSRNHEDSKEAFCRPERIKSSSLVTEVIPDAVMMACQICQKLLRRKHYNLGSAQSSSDVSVVAVLVCGHAYHADCLEQRTCHEDRRDPPCPLCLGLLSRLDVSIGQE